MNRRFLLSLAASALFGLVAILIFQKILRDRVDTQGQFNQQKIVYAATRILAGTVIAQNHIKTVPHEAKSLPDGAILNQQDVIGKVAQVELEPNIPIQRKAIASEKESHLLRPREGYRAIAIRVDEASSVAGFATPGSIVDVVVALPPSANSKPVAKTLVQSLRVLANGQQTQAKAEGQGRIGNTVTLEVTPTQAGILTLAQREGTLALALRHPGDIDLVSVQPVVMGSVMEEFKNEPRVGATPPPTSSVSLPPWYAQTPTPKPSQTPTPSTSPVQRMAMVRVIKGDQATDVPVKQQ